MERNLIMAKQASTLIILLSSLTGACLFLGVKFEYFIIFMAVWLTVCLCILFKPFTNNGQFFRSVMYFLVMTTFLNQSALSIHVGFFSLFLYRIVLIAALMVFIVHLVSEKRLSHYWNQVQTKEILLFLLFWMIYGVISLLWAKSLLEGIKYLFLLGIGILFIFLASFTFTHVSRLLLFQKIWIIMSICLILIGFVNHFGHIQLPTSTLYGGPSYKLSYPTAVFFNQNDFATFLSIAIFFFITAAKASRNVGSKTMLILFAILSVYLIHLTESRASLLGVILGCLVYLFIHLKARVKKITVMVIGILALFSPFYMGGIFNKIQTLFTAYHQYPTNQPLPSNVVRAHLLQNTFHYLIDSFGFGVGAGNIPVYLKERSIYDIDQVYEVHNWLAEIAGNFGIGILLGYITMYSYLFFTLYKLYKRQTNRQYKALLEAGMMGLVGFAVSSISPSSVSNLYFHWVFLAFTISTVSVFKRKNHLMFTGRSPRDKSRKKSQSITLKN
ncbi:hypothetical protein GMB86_07510 [Terrilactibacillus sp. BCM23-1]|uniref:O-antigen ligase-related domain-containing protein n=1 Tax=Terrilactibacillus tamarindi TaxID=2599694 RepID=A0A6N8CUN3_9BACI|nr:O-antigen ligase family protein [Terrilactibacillus tamarindi]MTT31856.1 hypothetical protein [Terrilactibacillus tamarindi]